MQETHTRSLGQEDPLEKEMATDSSILAWVIPRTEEPGKLHSAKSRTQLSDFTSLHYAFYLYSLFFILCSYFSAFNAGDLGSIPGSGRSPGEGNGNPLQYSCLENSMERGVWLATVHGVAGTTEHACSPTLQSTLSHCSSQSSLGI